LCLHTGSSAGARDPDATVPSTADGTASSFAGADSAVVVHVPATIVPAPVHAGGNRFDGRATNSLPGDASLRADGSSKLCPGFPDDSSNRDSGCCVFRCGAALQGGGVA